MQDGVDYEGYEFIGDLQRRSLGVSLELEYFDGYEQRLIQWGCAGCKFFEKKVFKQRIAF